MYIHIHLYIHIYIHTYVFIYIYTYCYFWIYISVSTYVSLVLLMFFVLSVCLTYPTTFPGGRGAPTTPREGSMRCRGRPFCGAKNGSFQRSNWWFNHVSPCWTMIKMGFFMDLPSRNGSCGSKKTAEKRMWLVHGDWSIWFGGNCETIWGLNTQENGISASTNNEENGRTQVLSMFSWP